MTLVKKWKSTFTKEKEGFKPQILCRICNRKFFASMSDLHNKYCVEQKQKEKEQRGIDMDIIKLSS